MGIIIVMLLDSREVNGDDEASLSREVEFRLNLVYKLSAITQEILYYTIELTSSLVVRTARVRNNCSNAGRIAGCKIRCHNFALYGKTGTRRNFNEPIRSLISVLAGVPDTASELRRGMRATISL